MNVIDYFKDLRGF